MARVIDKIAMRAGLIWGQDRLWNILSRHLEVMGVLFAHIDPNHAGAAGQSGLDERIHRSDFVGVDKHIKKGQWSVACMNYLDLSCSHISTLYNLARGTGQYFDREVEAFVKSANFEWIQREEAESDTYRRALTEVLGTSHKKYEYWHRPLTSKDVKVVKSVIASTSSERFGENPDAWDDTNLCKGHIHPEALILSYRSL